MTTFTMGIFGQSYAQGLAQGAAIAMMADEFARAGYTLNVVTYAAGGSSICKENAPSTNYYWWDHDTNSAGPLLTSALGVIAGASVKPDRHLWLQGPGESFSSAPNNIARFTDGTKKVLAALKAACAPKTPGTITDIIGRRIGTNDVPGIQQIREAQLGMVADGTYAFGCDTFDLPYLGDDPLYLSDEQNSHPTPRGYAILSFRITQRILRSALKPFRMPPRVTAVARDGNDVLLTVSKGEQWDGGGEFSIPDMLSHFAIRDGSGLLTGSDLVASRDATNVVRLSPSRSLMSGAVALYPYGMLNDIDRDGLVYDDHGSPLRSLMEAIP